MTIKDIAKAANVSAATVSRIINQKDDNISQETRERVLRIIQENNYVPYAKIRDRILSQTKSIGLVIPTLLSTFYVQFASEMQQLARKRGYSLVLALASGNAQDEISTLNEFSQNRTDGVLLFSGTDEGIACLTDLHQQGMSAVILNHYRHPSGLPQLYRDSTELARQCTQQLLDNNCTQIGLVLRPSSSKALHDAILAGYTEALTAAGLPVQRNFITYSDANLVENFRGMVDNGLNGIVCQYVDAAQTVYSSAATDGIRIPGELSVISMEDSPDVSVLSPSLTAAHTDVKEMARLAFECLLSQIEHTPLTFSSQKMDCPIQLRRSIRKHKDPRAKIVVAGFVNTDILLSTPELPRYGKTQISAYMADYAGGKGANQAYGISRLGGNVYLMACLGADRQGHTLFEYLSRAGIQMDGVSFQQELPTGNAYISLYPNGKSSVLINPGANTALTAQYVLSQQRLLDDAAYCLAQTDVPMETVAQLRSLCDSRGVPMILCSAYEKPIDQDILRGLHILILKAQDIPTLYPGFSREDCIRHLLEQGVENVIITAGNSGCLWGKGQEVRSYPGYNYPCIDETGTNDVFIGCLVTLLSEGQTMAKAIRAAVWAAAYSATRLGVQNGFPNRKLLEDVLSGTVELSFPQDGEAAL